MSEAITAWLAIEWFSEGIAALPEKPRQRSRR